MKVVSTEKIRTLDRITIEKFHVPGFLLMERAGRRVADHVIRICRENYPGNKNITIVAGHGNNGGDSFVAARFLKEEGFVVNVLLAGVIADLHGDALEHFKQMSKSRISARELPTEKDWQQLDACQPGTQSELPAVVVDGVLGTGISGPVHGTAALAIRFINSLSNKSCVLSIDVPSGLNSDTGRVEGEAVRADLTVTMGLPKKGLIQQCALEYSGKLEVADIGFPPQLLAEIESSIELITGDDIAPMFPRRKRVSHKGDFGHLLILGGSAGYSGAIALAAGAAVRSGVGLVSVVVPEHLVPVTAAAVPEAMVHGASATETGSLDDSLWDAWEGKLGNFTALLAGPGMTRHAATRRLIEKILHAGKLPLLLDADALNVFEGEASKLSARKEKLVITPHPGEMARLLGITTQEVQSNRFEVAGKAAMLTGSTVVLKGAATLATEKDGKIYVNLTGNPGMASGGMGDVLSGLLGGLLAQRMPPLDAARAAVYLHGRAGDLAAAQKTENAIIARDLIACLPEAFLETITPQANHGSFRHPPP